MGVLFISGALNKEDITRLCYPRLFTVYDDAGLLYTQTSITFFQDGDYEIRYNLRYLVLLYKYIMTIACPIQ